MVLPDRREGKGKLWVASKTESSNCQRKTDSNPQWNFNHFLGLVLLAIIIAVGIKWLVNERNPKEDFFEFTEGEPVLAPWREKKLLKELDEIDDAVQYALIATVAGEYPCYSCPGGQLTIYLEVGQTWKYGITRKGETGRYRGQLPDGRLLFFIQFRGPYSECLKEEKRKIYLYALLPENQAREIPLIRPPGNRNDG